jgi:hypothetical protein
LQPLQQPLQQPFRRWTWGPGAPGGLN